MSWDASTNMTLINGWVNLSVINVSDEISLLYPDEPLM